MKKINLIILILLIGILIGFNIKKIPQNIIADSLQLDEQEATIRAIKKVSPAVVSIGVVEETIDIENKKTLELVGAGTGFLISSDGLILTNKHVINPSNIVDIKFKNPYSYKIVLNNRKKQSTYYAQLIDIDPLNDLAVLKIFDKNLPSVELGNSDELELGSSVIAIGNVLGRYANSVTKGIVSGVARSLTASNHNTEEMLSNIIQTDAGINFGNSGGPLINLEGKIIGINVAKDIEGNAIGFAIPINDAKPVIKSILEIGRIARPYLGVRYVMITPEIKQELKLTRDTGAIIIDEDGISGIALNSPAQKIGLLSGDIIFEINAIKIEGQNTLLSVVQKYKPGNKIGMKIQRGNKIIIKIILLEELK